MGRGGAVDGHWRRVLEAARNIQAHFPECVLVGGTAAALHAEHRISLDADHVLEGLRAQFPAVLAQLESLAGWKTARLRPPVLILGRFEGVETGIRQLRRRAPLETEELAGIRVPTLAEMIRIKAWMVITRNAARDLLDLCALAETAGRPLRIEALRPFDQLYPQSSGETVTRQLAKQLAEPRPHDLGAGPLARYRGLEPPWTDWDFVVEYAGSFAAQIAGTLLGLDPEP